MSDTTKIDQISVLGQLNNTYKNYATTVEDATSQATTQLTSKVDGSEADAIDAYLAKVNELTTTAFVTYPNHLSYFATILGDYRDAVEGAGFSTNVTSDPNAVATHVKSLKTTQVTEMETPATEAKSMIDSISFLEATKIESYIETLSTDLDTIGTNYTTTAETLQNALTTFISELQSYKDHFQSDKEQLNRFALMSNPTSGLSPAVIVQMVENGVDPDGVDGYLDAINSKDDALFLTHMMNKDYEKMFAIESKNISDKMYSVLAMDVMAMTNEIIENGSEEDVTNLNLLLNGLLMQNGQLVQDHSKRLLSQYDLITIQIADNLLNASGADKEILRTALDRSHSLTSLWEAMYCIGVEYPSTKSSLEHGQGTMNRVTLLNNLTLDVNGQFKFDLHYRNDITINGKETEGKEIKIRSIEALVYTDQFGAEMADSQNALFKIRKERAEALQNLVKEAALSGLGIYLPGVKTGLEILDKFLSDNPGKGISKGSSKALESLFKENKAGISGTSGVVDAYLSFMLKWSSLDKKDSAVHEKIMNILLNEGGTGTYAGTDKDGKPLYIGSSQGLFTEEAAQRLEILQHGGFSAYIMEKSGVDEINQLTTENNIPQKYHDFITDPKSTVKLEDLDISILWNTFEVYSKNLPGGVNGFNDWFELERKKIYGTK